MEAGLPTAPQHRGSFRLFFGVEPLVTIDLFL